MKDTIDKKCSCDFCKRNRKYKKIKEKVNDQEVEDFIDELFNELFHAKDQLEYEKVLRRAYSAKFGHISLTKATDIITDYEQEES